MKYLAIICFVFVGSFAGDWKIFGEYEYKVFEEMDWVYADRFEEFQQLCAGHGGEVAILKTKHVAKLVTNSAAGKLCPNKIEI